MADDDIKKTVTPDTQKSTDVGGEDKGKGEDKTKDTADLSKKLGSLETENTTLKSYQEKVDPVLQTIWADPELYKKVEAAYKKRLSGTAAEEGEEDKEEEGEEDKDKKKDKQPVRSATDSDTRNAMIKKIVDDFSTKMKIDTLAAEDKKSMNVKVGAMLQEMLDPKGNKTLAQIMEDVPLTKLPQFLEHAYFLVNKDKVISDAKEAAKQETLTGSTGVIGGFSATSVEPDTMSLTPKEKAAAANIGVSEDKYLARKKEIAKRNNQLF